MNGEPRLLQPSEHRSAIRTLLYVLFGPIVWALHLTVIYGVQSVACAMLGSPMTPILAALDAIQLVVAVATVIALLVLAGGWYGLVNPGGAMSEGADERNHFLEDTMRLLAALSALAVLAAGSAALVIPTCPSLR